MRFYLLVLTVFFAACGSGGGSDAERKALFSKWTEAGTSQTLDLTGLTFGRLAIKLGLSTYSSCNCTLDLIGTETAGTATIYGCTYDGPTGPHHCSPSRHVYDYTNANATLTLCEQGFKTCSTYR